MGADRWGADPGGGRDPGGGAPSGNGAPAGDEVGIVERAREQLAKALRRGPGTAVQEQFRPAVLHQQLPAPAAGRERLPVPGRNADGHEPGAPASDEGRNEPAFGTKGETEGCVLDIAARYDVAVVAQAGSPDPEAGVRSVGPGGRFVSELPKAGPIRG